MIEKEKVGVLLVNTGSAASPSVGDVRQYLSEFLMDERVIDIPHLFVDGSITIQENSPSS